MSNIDSVGVPSRILLAWNPLLLQVSVVLSSAQMIRVRVENVESHAVFYVSVIYAYNSTIDRRRLWHDLSLAGAIVGHVAWIQMGDYNVVRRIAERMDGFDYSAAAEFNDCLNSLEVDDFPANGFWFTWTNKQGGLGDNKSKLDRAMVNARWLTSFPDSEAWFLHPGVSDHCQILVTILPPAVVKRPSSFFPSGLLMPRFKAC